MQTNTSPRHGKSHTEKVDDKTSVGLDSRIQRGPAGCNIAPPSYLRVPNVRVNDLPPDAPRWPSIQPAGNDQTRSKLAWLPKKPTHFAAGVPIEFGRIGISFKFLSIFSGN